MRTHLGIMNLFGHFHEKREPTPGLNYPRDSVMRNMRARNCRNNEKGSDDGLAVTKEWGEFCDDQRRGAVARLGPGQVQTII